MPKIAGWDHWQISFDRAGHVDAASRAALLDQIAQAGLTDLIVMSHGWNASPKAAGCLYERWLGMLPSLMPAGSGARPGTAGVYWPAMLWPDEPPPSDDAADADDAADGGAASLPEPAGSAGTPGAPVAALAEVYPDPGQQQILGQLAALLDAQSPDPQALDRFHELMRQLGDTEPQVISPEDAGPLSMLGEDPRDLAARFAATLDVAAAQAATGGADEGFDEGGAAVLPDDTLPDTGDEDAAAGLGRITGRLWNGAKEALRQFTYWQMKQRAGTVGQHGLGPLLADLGRRSPDLRVHLVGHSFGARLVSFSLLGLDDGSPSPVRSLTLLEGAFSHSAFAPRLPHDPARAGALSGMMARVAGPLLACYSSHDTAVGLFYPAASMTAHDDAAGLTDELVSRWGAIGHDGAQGVAAAVLPLPDVRARFPLTASRFTNIDASDVVRQGKPPSGAHSDIVHPELAWAMLTASGLT
jgi:hypothetical protein